MKSKEQQVREKKIKGSEKEVDSALNEETFDEAEYYEDNKFELGGEDYKKKKNLPENQSDLHKE